jgi:small subunit ribosomal protein S20
MNKKQRNRKLVAQNKRNRMINRRYSSTIKTLFKLFLGKIKTFKMTEGEANLQSNEKINIQKIGNSLFSIIDKAIKKTVIHKNTAARKKSRISIILAKM